MPCYLYYNMSFSYFFTDFKNVTFWTHAHSKVLPLIIKHSLYFTKHLKTLIKCIQMLPSNKVGAAVV